MLKKLLGKLFRFNQQTQANIQWQQTDEPVLFSWVARGREGNKKDILLGKLGFIGSIFLFGVLPTLLLLMKAKTWLDAIATVVCGMGVIAGPIIFMIYFFTIAGEFYTYRVTRESIELARWNEAIPKFKEIMQLFICITIVFAMFIFITDPAALFISLGGMVGVGLIAGTTLFSKSYLKTHLKYKHMITRWDSLLKIEIDNRGKHIILIWGKDFYDKKQQIDLFNLFCTPEIFDEVVKLIQQQVKEENLEKGLHYCETWG